MNAEYRLQNEGYTLPKENITKCGMRYEGYTFTEENITEYEMGNAE